MKNSINISRWIPQILYYFFAYKQLTDNGKDIAVSITSGNFGNLFSCLVAISMGLPFKNVIAYRLKSNTNRIRKVTKNAPRGLILDRNGEILVDNYPVYVITAIPGEMSDKSNQFKLIADYIEKTYTLPERKIFVFNNADEPNELYCTYNVAAHDDFNKAQSTILIHRKKETNTLYTVNALNVIIRKANNGLLD